MTHVNLNTPLSLILGTLSIYESLLTFGDLGKNSFVIFALL